MTLFQSPVLKINLMSESILQKEVLFNEAVLIIDAIISGQVLAIQSSPPATPSDGQVYIVGVSPTGAWSGKVNQIAYYYNGWQYFTAPNPYQVYVINTASYYTWNGTAWVAGTLMPFAISNATDAAISSPTDGQFLKFSGTDSKWHNASVTIVTTLQGLTDVNVAEGVGIDGYCLTWNNATSKWAASARTVASSSDVAISSPVNGQALLYNGTTNKWYNGTLPSGVTTISGLSDVTVTEGTGIAGYVLYWNNTTSKWSAEALPTYPTTLAGLTDVNVVEGSGIDSFVLSWSNATGKWVASAITPGSTTLAGDTDVSVASPTNGQVLTWNGTLNKWQNSTLPTGTATIAGLSDVTVTEGTGIDGYVLYWNNTTGKWSAEALPTGVTTLSGMSDVTVITPLSGDTLLYNTAAAKWQNTHRNPVSNQVSSYTLALTDEFTTINMNSASAINCTVPPNSSVAFRIGDEIALIQGGVGSLTVIPGAGVTINSPQGLVFNNKNLQAILTKVAINTWNLTYLGLPAQNPLPIYNAGSVSGATALDFHNGDTQIISLIGNTTLTVINWPAIGLAKLTLIAQNTGAYTLAFPTAKWSGASGAPTLTSGAGREDWFILVTIDGGATLRGNVVGQNYA